MQKAIRLVTRFLAKCQKDKINAYSAQIAFFIILSIIPFLMVFSSMLQYTSITEDMVFEIIERVMPQYVAPFLVTLVKEIYTRSMGSFRSRQLLPYGLPQKAFSIWQMV